MGLAQQSLFAEEELAPKRYVPGPRHVRNSLSDLLGEMRAAERWLWEGVVLSLYHADLKLFTLSIFWRASVGKRPEFAAFQLDREIENRIKGLLISSDPSFPRGAQHIDYSIHEPPRSSIHHSESGHP